MLSRAEVEVKRQAMSAHLYTFASRCWAMLARRYEALSPMKDQNCRSSTSDSYRDADKILKLNELK